MIAFRVASIPMRNVLSAEVGRICRRHLPLLFADVTPKLVQLESVHLDESHHLIMQCRATVTDADTKAHDRVTVNAS
jgi:hypothetical protein